MIEVVLGTQRQDGGIFLLINQKRAFFIHLNGLISSIKLFIQTVLSVCQRLFQKDNRFYLFSDKKQANREQVVFSTLCLPVQHPGRSNLSRILLDKAVELVEELNAAYLEVRDSINNSSFHSSSCYSTYILELSNNPDHVWRKFKSNVRRNINKSRKYRVMVEETKDMEALKVFYQLNCINKKSGFPTTWFSIKTFFIT